VRNDGSNKGLKLERPPYIISKAVPKHGSKA